MRRIAVLSMVVGWTFACAGSTGPRPADDGLEQGFVLMGARWPGGRVADIAVRAGKIVPLSSARDLPVASAQGRWIVPGFIDSHVHLTLIEEPGRLVERGVVAAVDLAEPLAAVGSNYGELNVVHAGPMITGAGGYPTQGWGSDGYGVECSNDACARAAVEGAVDRGAAVIKVAIAGQGGIGADPLRAVVATAKVHGVPVVAHALTDADARQAAVTDVLAHTPVGRLSSQTAHAWNGKYVITTLSAFDPSSAVANLRRLREAGALPLYGTDLGNTQVPGVSADEIELMLAAGMKGADIVYAATAAPAAVWGLPTLGHLKPGADASFLLVSDDPYRNPKVLARSDIVVFVRGRQL